MQSNKAISIRFFIGISLLLSGLLILGAGWYEFSHPPRAYVVLYQVHANVWRAGVLLVLGAIYCYAFAPRKQEAQVDIRRAM